MNTENLTAIAENKIKSASAGLRSERAIHLDLFRKNGMKETVHDSYKFTNLESFFSKLSLDTTSEALPAPHSADFPTITFVNGKFSASDKLPEGVVVRKISEHFEEIKDLLKESNALSHLHHSMVEEGMIIEIGRKAEVKVPVRLLNVMTTSGISSPTHLIVAHPLSRVTIIEDVRGQNISHANISETYIRALEGSFVEHIAVQEETTEGLNHFSLFSEVGKDATVKSLLFHASGKMNRSNLELNLNAPGANGESYSLFLTNGNEHSDINTVINHKSPDTLSSQICKGILDGDSKGIFTGKIHIFPKAQRVVSSQLNKNLLLSKKAHVHSQPQLEIFADDVKCSHGSTTGQLSPDEVFYFEARGIPEDKARGLLAFGFGMEVAQKVENKMAREHVMNIIRKNLANKFSLGRES